MFERNVRELFLLSLSFHLVEPSPVSLHKRPSFRVSNIGLGRWGVIRPCVTNDLRLVIKFDIAGKLVTSRYSEVRMHAHVCCTAVQRQVELNISPAQQMLIKLVYSVNAMLFAIRRPLNTSRGNAFHSNMTIIVICVGLLVVALDDIEIGLFSYEYGQHRFDVDMVLHLEVVAKLPEVVAR